jgi:hypothetical protein
MPQFLRPEQFTLSLEGGTPIIHLDGMTVSSSHGWSVLSRATLLVVDGPGDEGFLLGRMTSPGADLAPEGWDAAVSSAGFVEVSVAGVRFAAAVVE